MMRIWTSRYQNPELRRPDLVKVGITVGRPKFPTLYGCEMVRLLAPPGWLFHENDRLTFRRKFRTAVLDPSRDTILAELRGLSERHGGRDLVLLCFEDVTRPGEWCHRQVVAEWLEEQGLGPVEEL